MQGIRNLTVRRRPSGLDCEEDERVTGFSRRHKATPSIPVSERPRSYPLSTPVAGSEAPSHAASSQGVRPYSTPGPGYQSDRIASHPQAPLLLKPSQRRITTGAAKGPKIWDMQPEEAAFDQPSPQRPISGPHPDVSPPPPSAPPSAERAKTRLLGFHGEAPVHDILSAKPEGPVATGQFPIGWVVVVDGPGRGASFALEEGLSTIGREADQTVSLDFGDTAISRSQHVAIAYDEEENCAFIGHGGKQNIVRLNGKPLLTTERLSNRDAIKVGKTTLQFIAFCGEGFSWGQRDGSSDG